VIFTIPGQFSQAPEASYEVWSRALVSVAYDTGYEHVGEWFADLFRMAWQATTKLGTERCQASE